MTSGPTVRAIGAVNAIAAKLASDAGFEALWVSSLEVSASLGLPDRNLIGIDDLTNVVRACRRVTSIPIVVDIDNAQGSVDAAFRYGRELREVGVAGVCLEDSAFPKRNSFVVGPHSLAEMSLVVDQIQALCEGSHGMKVYGRTQCLISGGALDSAHQRIVAFTDAGASGGLIHSKDPSGSEATQIARAWRAPGDRLIVPTSFPQLSLSELEDLGFNVVIYANQLTRSWLLAGSRLLNGLSYAGKCSPNELASLESLLDVGSNDVVRSD